MEKYNIIKGIYDEDGGMDGFRYAAFAELFSPKFSLDDIYKHCRQLDDYLAFVKSPEVYERKIEEMSDASASMQLNNFLKREQPVDACIILCGGFKKAYLFAKQFSRRQNMYVQPKSSKRKNQIDNPYTPFLCGNFNPDHNLLLIDEDCWKGDALRELTDEFEKRGYDRNKIYAFLFNGGVTLSENEWHESMPFWKTTRNYSGPIIDKADNILQLCCSGKAPEFPFLDGGLKEKQKALFPPNGFDHFFDVLIAEYKLLSPNEEKLKEVIEYKERHLKHISGNSDAIL